MVVEDLWDGRAQVEEGKMEAVPWADLEKPYEVLVTPLHFIENLKNLQ